MVKLEDLAGEHILDAVDFSNEQFENGSRFVDCQSIRFRLDGLVYVATEDPDDGYRSRMDDLVIGDFEMSNVFPPIRVVGRYEGKVLGLSDIITGKTVLEVGTGDWDDYYPYFVANFDPTAMIHNVSGNLEQTS